MLYPTTNRPQIAGLMLLLAALVMLTTVAPVKAAFAQPRHAVERDAAQASDVEALGLRARAVDTLMRDVSVAAQLAETALELAESLR